MITLTDIAQEVKFYLTGAITTNPVVGYASYRGIGNGNNDIYNYSASVVDGTGVVLVPSPTDEGREHLIHNIMICNEDTVAASVLVRIEGMPIYMYACVLQPNERVIYTEEGEWQIYTSDGIPVTGATSSAISLPDKEIGFGNGVTIISDPIFTFDKALSIFTMMQLGSADVSLYIDNDIGYAIMNMINGAGVSGGSFELDNQTSSVSTSRWSTYDNGANAGAAKITLVADGSSPSQSKYILRIDGYDVIKTTDNALQLLPKSSFSTMEVRFYEFTSNGTDYIGFKAPNARTSNTSVIIALPVDDPTAGQVMTFSAPSGGVITAAWGTPASAYTDEMAQDAVGAMVSAEFTYTDATPLLAINAIAESKITFTDITTGNAATTQHGYLKKLSGNAYDSLDGLGAWVRRSNGIIACAMGNGNTVNASTTTYFQPFLGSSANATETNRQAVMPTPGTAKGLYVRTKNTQTATGSLVITVRNNAANTSIVVTIAAGSVAGTYSDTSNNFSYSAGDKLSFQVQNNGTATSTEIMDIMLATLD